MAAALNQLPPLTVAMRGPGVAQVTMSRPDVFNAFVREIRQLFARLHVGPIVVEGRELTAQTISRVRGTDEARRGFALFRVDCPTHWIPV